MVDNDNTNTLLVSSTGQFESRTNEGRLDSNLGDVNIRK